MTLIQSIDIHFNSDKAGKLLSFNQSYLSVSFIFPTHSTIRNWKLNLAVPFNGINLETLKLQEWDHGFYTLVFIVVETRQYVAGMEFPWKSQCMEPWRQRLCCSGKLKMLKIPEIWVIQQEMVDIESETGLNQRWRF